MPTSLSYSHKDQFQPIETEKYNLSSSEYWQKHIGNKVSHNPMIANYDWADCTYDTRIGEATLSVILYDRNFFLGISNFAYFGRMPRFMLSPLG